MKDFFISYNRADKQWAEWIAWKLEEAGYTVVIQAWDFRPGGNFVLDMQRAAAETHKTIAVLSETYLKSSFTQPEWASVFVNDPQSLERKLIPVRVKECRPEGLLRPIVYADLVGLSEVEAEKTLLDALKDSVRPEQSPAFPGDRVSEVVQADLRILTIPQTFPSSLSRVQKIRESALQTRLNALIQDYEVGNQQLSYITNDLDRGRLERQLLSISQEMEKVAAELDALGQ
jgi:TIR domain/Effector-associated domain 9